MSVRLGRLSWLLLLPLLLPLLLLVPGGCCSTWSVVYAEQQVCVVRNATAVLQCSFTYPGSLTVMEVKWAHGEERFYRGPFCFDTNNNNSSKFEYIGDKIQNCSLKIHHAEQTDEGQYAFRIITDIEREKYTGANGPWLQVTDLELWLSSGDGTMKEGDSLNLNCRNECDYAVESSSSFTWFKNGQPLETGPVLSLMSVSPEHSGNYSCSLSEHKGTTSGERYINVEYGPKNTSMSVRPSTEVDSGTNFTLTCSSTANPTVEEFVWFEVIEDEQKEVERSSTSATQLPVFVSSVGGQFFCRASNKHGSQDSTVVRLTIKEPTPTNKTAVIIVTVVLLLVVIIISSITGFKMKESTHAEEENTQAEVHMSTVYANWQAIEGNNQPQARNDCNGGAAPAEVVYASIVFGPEKMQQKRQQQARPDDENTIYSLVSK